MPSSLHSSETDVSRCAMAAWIVRTWGLCQGECPPAFASPRSRRLKPSHGPLADKLAFEFGERGKDAEGQTAGRGCRVDRGALAGEDLQADATVGEHGDGLHQVMQAAAQPVEFPNDEDITFA